jgi:protein arginine kinase
MPLPSWLSQEGPDSDVVVSSRFRCARNLVGCRFPRTASDDELSQIQTRLEKAAGPGWIIHRRLSEAERDYLLGCRLISPDFQHRELNRSLLVDEERVVSLMINEEDHLRIQALAPGLSLERAEKAVRAALARMSERVEFVSHPLWGWLTSSPVNAGEAHRRSVLVHLPGAAHAGEIDRMKDALTALGVTVRGVFGEASHPVGEFRQVSLTRGTMADFRGACRYLIEKEREAREAAGAKTVERLAREARNRLVASQEVTSAEAIRELSAIRWLRAMEGTPARAREVDEWISGIELQGTPDPKTAARYRAASIREKLEQAERGGGATEGPASS